MGLPRALTAVVQPITRHALGRKGTVLGTLLSAWPAIVGDELARKAVPMRVTLSGSGHKEGVLVLRAEPADALALHYDIPHLLDRINGHYGYQAVARIKLVQAPTGASRPGRAAAAGRQDDRLPQDLAERVGAVGDERLRHSLARLGRAISDREESEEA